jgi:phage virion morphogenesis protein
MTGTTIDIQVNAGEVGKRLHRIAERTEHLDDVLRELGEILVPSTQARFVQGVAPDGSPWAPLAPSTLRRKKGPGILRESLALQGSIHYQVEGDELHVGTNLPYAAIHQLGGKIKHKERSATLHFRQDPRTGEVGNRFVKRQHANFAQDVTIGAHETEMTPRPYLGVSAEDEAKMLRVVADYLVG